MNEDGANLCNNIGGWRVLLWCTTIISRCVLAQLGMDFNVIYMCRRRRDNIAIRALAFDRRRNAEFELQKYINTSSALFGVIITITITTKWIIKMNKKQNAFSRYESVYVWL